MKQPLRKRVQRHKVTPPPDGVALAQVAERAHYVGSPEHKRSPSFAGRLAPRSDASICDPSLSNQQTRVQSWLRAALRIGNCGGPWENGYPRYVWHKEDALAYEARLTNQASGEYKGYPIHLDQCPI